MNNPKVEVTLSHIFIKCIVNDYDTPTNPLFLFLLLLLLLFIIYYYYYSWVVSCKFPLRQLHYCPSFVWSGSVFGANLIALVW